MGVSDINFIQPMQKWDAAEKLSAKGENSSSTGAIIPFQDVFESAVDQVKQTQADVENKQYLLATGQLEDAHSLPIAEAKAQVSVDLLVTLRNKALEAYNELIRMNI